MIKLLTLKTLKKYRKKWFIAIFRIVLMFTMTSGRTWIGSVNARVDVAFFFAAKMIDVGHEKNSLEAEAFYQHSN